MSITNYINRVTEQSIQEAVNIVMDDKNLDFFTFMERYMQVLKKKGLCNLDIENKTHQEIFLYAFCSGVAAQIERAKEPVAQYIKENKHIFIEFEHNGRKQCVNVPESFDNKQIKKIISNLIGESFKGNFRKVSEFEQAKFLKQFEKVGV